MAIVRYAAPAHEPLAPSPRGLLSPRRPRAGEAGDLSDSGTAPLRPSTAAIPWEGPRGGDAGGSAASTGDAVLTAVIGQLKSSEWLARCVGRSDGKARMWRLVASHLPGRTASECQERWRLLSRQRNDAS